MNDFVFVERLVACQNVFENAEYLLLVERVFFDLNRGLFKQIKQRPIHSFKNQNLSQLFWFIEKYFNLGLSMIYDVNDKFIGLKYFEYFDFLLYCSDKLLTILKF